METQNYTYEELAERVVELENAIFNIQTEMLGFLKAKDHELMKVHKTLSWRVTLPLRVAKRIIVRFLKTSRSSGKK